MNNNTQEKFKVKKEYLLKVCINKINFTYDDLKKSRKEYFTLDEFIKLRAHLNKTEGLLWGDDEINKTEVYFNKAVEFQKADEVSIDTIELGTEYWVVSLEHNEIAQAIFTGPIYNSVACSVALGLVFKTREAAEKKLEELRKVVETVKESAK